MSFLLRLSVMFTFAVIFMDSLWIWSTDFTYNFSSSVPVLSVAIMLVVTGLLINRYSTYSWTRRITSFLVWLGMFVSYMAFGAAGSYLFASVGAPLKDSWFAAADQLIGFDWVALLTFFSHHAWLGQYTSTLYMSSATTMFVVLIYLSVSNHHKQGDLLLASTLISSFLTIFLTAPFAATGPFGFYNVSPELYKDFAPVVTGAGGEWLSDLLHLRDGSFRELGNGVYKGIVQFPSFHTILSVLMILALRGTGPAFVIGGFYNLLILLTVPIDGGHYLVDMIAGALIAVGVWFGLAAFDRAVEAGRTTFRPAMPQWAGAGLQAFLQWTARLSGKLAPVISGLANVRAR